LSVGVQSEALFGCRTKLRFELQRTRQNRLDSVLAQKIILKNYITQQVTQQTHKPNKPNKPNKRNMRIAFDLDNTLIRDQYPFPLEPESQRWLLRLFGFEPLRKNTIQLMKSLQQSGDEIWIYTSSKRDVFYLRLLFRAQGIFLGGIVNLIIHQEKVRIRSSKYPPAFGINLLIDDSYGVQIEARKYHFNMLRVVPWDEEWHLKVMEKIEELKAFPDFDASYQKNGFF
jgi:hypothetical protein